MKLTRVSGTVKFDGKPLPQGTISFVGDNGSRAAGEISSSGYYSLSTSKPGDGVQAGSYKVRIESMSSPPKMTPTGGVEPGTSAIPDRYNETATSELTATVKETSAETINFDLKP